MIDLIEDNREAIVELCKRYGVRLPAVSSSAASIPTQAMWISWWTLAITTVG